jgi:ubiquinone/menaquinone biosynthesis C-methylase UbiE
MAQIGNPVKRVTRSKNVAKDSYDRLSKWYDFIAGTSEWKFVQIGLELLQASRGETILDIGFGTGKGICSIAKSVGETGQVYGIDLSEGMFQIATTRLDQTDLSSRVQLRCGDAIKLPYADNFFEGVFMSFTLELFDTPEIPIVLKECYRVLRSEHRLVVVALSKKSQDSLSVRLYEWAHEKFPNYVDCRPIYLKMALQEAEFQIAETQEIKMWGLPVDIILANKI